MSDAENPYAQPNLIDDGPSTSPHDIAPLNDPDGLAPRMTRLVAAFVDGMLIMIVFMPAMFFSGYFQRAAAQQLGIVEQLVMSMLGMVIFLIFNGYPLMTRGQTLGKMITRIQVVDYETTMLLPLHRVWAFRYLWTLPLLVITILIPGNIDDQLINLVTTVDALMIFGPKRRCLHDLIAGSKVVYYRPGRQHLNSIMSP